MLIWPESDGPEDQVVRRNRRTQRLQGSTPAKVVGEVFRGDAVEAAHPSLEAAVVSVDVVDMEIGRLWARFAWRRQDVRRDAGLAGEGGNRRATVAAELVGRGDSAAESGGNGHPVQLRQHRIRGRALTVAGDDDGYLFGGEAGLGRFAASLASGARHAGSPALE